MGQFGLVAHFGRDGAAVLAGHHHVEDHDVGPQLKGHTLGVERVVYDVHIVGA